MVPINEPLLNGREKEYLNKCIETGWISSEGPFVAEFERQLSEKVDRKFGIAVSNGSVALLKRPLQRSTLGLAIQ